jgi:hypothetical protein
MEVALGKTVFQSLKALLRLSLRKKLIYTFLGGSLLTVLLFSVVIKGIMNDYFQRLAEVRLQYVSEVGQREIRTNVDIFKDAFKNIFEGITTTIGALAAPNGAILRRLECRFLDEFQLRFRKTANHIPDLEL